MPVTVILTSGKVVENVDTSALKKRSPKLKKMLRSSAGTGNTLKIEGFDIEDATWDKVYEWLVFHKDSTPSFQKKNRKFSNGSVDRKTVVVSAWETAYLAMEPTMLVRVVKAAANMKIEPLHELTCKALWRAINGLSPAKIREMFGIVPDFTPQEERIRADNQRAQDFGELAARLGQVVISKKK